MVMRKRKGKNKKKILKKRKRFPYPEASQFDFRNTDFLKEFITEKGKIVPRKISGLELKDQRKLSSSIKRARHAGLLSFTSNH